MKNLFRLTVVIFLGILGLSAIHAVEAAYGEVEFNIRLYDRRIYYVSDNPIYVQITITNNSPLPYRFKLADDRAFSIDVDLRTMTNRQLPHADSLIRKRTQNNHVFFREITVESRESFSFVEDLRDYVKFENPGSFRFRVFHYPELIRNAGGNPAPVRPVESNYLNLTLRPPVINGRDGIPLEMDINTGAVLVRQPLPPDEVVAYTIIARQQSQWERFFLYLDLEAMLQNNPHLRRRYITENEANRRRMVDEFRQNLQSSVVDDIVMIPQVFEIQRTEYNNNEGTVTVLQKFRRPNYMDLRQYRYFLEKRDNFWVIINYSVQGIGTEGID